MINREKRAGTPSMMVTQLTESATLAMARKSRELQQQGVAVVSLSLGEPDFNTPEFIKDAAVQAMKDNITHYPPVNGLADVRKAIAEKLKRDNDLTYSADEILVSTGAKQCIANAILSLVDEGDEVIMPSPYWVSYAEIVKMVGGVVVEVPAGVENDYKITADQLKNAITDKTRLIIYSSPCNPTGSVYSHEELQSFANVILEYPGLYIISDEIYELIHFGERPVSMAAIDGMWERTITVNGVSKAFAMTGWRIGYLAAPKWITDACNKMQGQVTSGANSIAQMAAKAAVQADPSVVADMVKTFRHRRDLVFDLLKDIPNIKINLPEGAFYFFPDIRYYLGKQYNGRRIDTAQDLCIYLLEEHRLALVTGEAFGDPNCIRISYATSDEILKEAMLRFKNGLAALQD
jgi:aspartate aminotransferase